jgi:hypothetical protein
MERTHRSCLSGGAVVASCLGEYRPGSVTSPPLAAHGITVQLPTGWEGRIFRRAAYGEPNTPEGRAGPPGTTTRTVVHLATIPLPPSTADFGSDVVGDLGAGDALVVLFEYEPTSAGAALFKDERLSRSLDPEDFSPGVLQRTIRGQAGYQKFFTEADRAFCAYVVLGSFANRAQVVPSVNGVLATIRIEPA